jgi:nucleotide-binding universal stress UspA family protein
MKTILHATDFSERSTLATRRAAALARECGATLHLIHVVDLGRSTRLVERERIEAAREMEDLVAGLMAEHVRVGSSRVVADDPFRAILGAVEAHCADVLILGYPRRRPLRDAFVGTTVDRVLRFCECPVLVVRAPVSGPYRKLMATTDLGAASIDALAVLADLRWPAGQRTLLHVFDVQELRGAAGLGQSDEDVATERARMKALQGVVSLAPRLGTPAFEPAVCRERIPLAHEILRAAEADSVDVIALATHARAGLRRMVLGSITSEVLANASVDVLAIPPGVGRAMDLPPVPSGG